MRFHRGLQEKVCPHPRFATLMPARNRPRRGIIEPIRSKQVARRYGSAGRRPFVAASPHSPEIRVAKTQRSRNARAKRYSRSIAVVKRASLYRSRPPIIQRAEPPSNFARVKHTRESPASDAGTLSLNVPRLTTRFLSCSQRAHAQRVLLASLVERRRENANLSRFGSSPFFGPWFALPLDSHATVPGCSWKFNRVSQPCFAS